MEKKDLSRLGKESPLAGPVKQFQGKLVLKGRDMLTHCRLGEKVHFRGAGKAAAVGNGYENFELFEVHGYIYRNIECP
jgi:hypothetical protein